MTDIREDIFTLLRHVLLEEPLPDGFSPDWDAVRGFLNRSKLRSLFLQSEIPELQADTTTVYKRLVFKTIYRNTALEIARAAKEADIPLAIFKGELLQDCYPEDVLRESGDIDIYTPPQYRQQVFSMFQDLHAARHADVDESQPGEVTFTFPNRVTVELHFVIAYDLDLKSWRRLEALGAFSEERFVEKNVADGAITTLDPEMSVFYLVYHLWQHYSVSDSSAVRMLADMAMYIRKNDAGIDWRRVRELTDAACLSRFAAAAFTLCAERLDMPLHGEPSPNAKRLEEDINWAHDEENDRRRSLRQTWVWTLRSIRCRLEPDGSLQLSRQIRYPMLLNPHVWPWVSMHRFWKIPM